MLPIESTYHGTLALPYTICFCLYRQSVLMLHRAFPPNAGLWNGLGGKIEAGESPLASIQREIHEEAGLDLKQASSVVFAGITTWTSKGHAPTRGMYTFLAHLSEFQAQQIHTLETPEGLITWKPLMWVCDPTNQAVVSNIPHFLPPMLETQTPREYLCEYEQQGFSTSLFSRLIIRPLPASINERL